MVAEAQRRDCSSLKKSLTAKSILIELNFQQSTKRNN